jgi:hypothetical protein
MQNAKQVMKSTIEEVLATVYGVWHTYVQGIRRFLKCVAEKPPIQISLKKSDRQMG